ncbi:hypothetical protein [Modicisalibacter luteus]|uniref:FUSC family protein n=1 Tax=Modicisalibacter luteus TaxID=453962 RepID=A0ABV7LVH6_9GAMM|nr:hypothetical protein [Halomonas lutea]GHB14293.1 hypothetical protein GCM10007159_40850 [Halomonas lutea]
MRNNDTAQDDRLDFSDVEQTAFGRCGTLTVLAVAFQVLLFPELGLWAGAILGACGTVPVMIAYGKNKPLLFSVAIGVMAVVGVIAQAIYGLVFDAAFSVADSLLAYY